MSILAGFLLTTLVCLNEGLPQWQQLKVDRLDKGGATLLKKYNFNKGLSSFSAIAGYDKTKGLGGGFHLKHQFGKGPQLSGGLYQSQNGGTEGTLGIKQTFNTGTSIFGQGNYGPNFESHTFGVGQKIGKSTSLFGSQTNSNYGGYKVKSHNVGITHKLKSGGTIKAFGGHNTFSGPSFGVGVNLPLGKRK